MRSTVLPVLTLCLLLTACDKPKPTPKPTPAPPPAPAQSLVPANVVLPDGGRYTGQVINGLLQGPGRIDYPDGSWYEGGFKDGLSNGQGKTRDPRGSEYTGDFVNGAFEGKGILNAEGEHYEGEFKKGVYNGQGTLKQGESLYSGGFKDGVYTGHGLLKYLNGDSYEGDFENGKMTGKGIRKDAIGRVSVGTFIDGKLEGPGSFTTSKGQKYTGGFHLDLMQGWGRFEDADGGVWTGTFSKNQLTGPGEMTTTGGDHYKGQFKNWEYAGEGELKQADGSLYKGHFDANNYDGQGSLTAADGTVQAGEWKNGLRVQDANGKPVEDTLETGLLNQGHLLEQALANVPASTPKQELYTLTVAGNGEQSVFMRETGFVDNLLAKHFNAYGQISLVNHRDHLADRPMATRENIRRAVRTLAERSGPEDLVFIYLTSHGSHDHYLSLVEPRLDLENLGVNDLADILKPLNGRDKVIVISACFAGGFIPELKDDHTLIMTAAREDRVSFGCSEEADFTYFGDALFAKALSHTDDLQEAFKQASATVAAREKEQHFEPSQPQIWAPPTVVAHWNALRQSQVRLAKHEMDNTGGQATRPANVQ